MVIADGGTLGPANKSEEEPETKENKIIVKINGAFSFANYQTTLAKVDKVLNKAKFKFGKKEVSHFSVLRQTAFYLITFRHWSWIFPAYLTLTQQAPWN